MALLFGQLLVLEEEERRERRQARLFRRTVRDAQDPFQLSEQEFIRQFRLNKEACQEFVNDVEPHMEAGRYSSRIPTVFRIVSALHFFATGSYQRSVGSNVNAPCSQTIVSRSIREVADIVVRHVVRKWVQFPRNNNEKDDVKLRFLERNHMPHIIGIVDGTHIAIYKPNQNEHVYVNRKGYHSINCQIICDGHMRITNVVARWPGSSHDAYIWRLSRIGHAMRGNYENGDTDSRIMGDSGYPCLPWLLVPLPHPRNDHEVAFNERFKRCRSLVERCIGLLKGRFRCLLKDRTLHYSPQTAAKIILTCTVLHNIALHFRVEDPTPMWDELDLELPMPANDGEHDAVYRQQGQASRNRYIQRYF